MYNFRFLSILFSRVQASLNEMTIKAFGFAYDVSKWTKQLFSRDIFTSTWFNIKNFVLYEQNCRAI